LPLEIELEGGRTPVSAPALYGYGYRVIDRVRDRDMYRVRVRVRGLAIAAPSYSGPNRFQWGRKLEGCTGYRYMATPDPKKRVTGSSNAY